MTKICSKCGEEKPATTEYFRKAKANKDGLMGQCRDCIKEYEKQYRKKNKESIRQYKKQWNQENKEYIKEYSKQYYEQYYEENKEYYKQYRQENKEYYREHNKQYRQENKEYIKEYIKEYSKRWRKENKEEVKEYQRQWRKENKEETKEYAKKYRKENIDKCRQHSQTRQARKRLLPATLTVDQWKKIKDDFNNQCAYCGLTEGEHKGEFNEQLHQEHFIPLSEGGEYTHNNIIPACRSCNCSKHNTDFFEWYPTYEYYNEEREQFILEYLGYIEDTQQLTLEVEVI